MLLFMATGQDREKSKLTVASAAENASDSDRTSKSAAAKLAAKVERFKQSRKSHSETRIVGGVAINTTVGKDVPLSVQSSSVSVKSEPELDNVKNKVHVYRFCSVSQTNNITRISLNQVCMYVPTPTYCIVIALYWIVKVVLTSCEAFWTPSVLADYWIQTKKAVHGLTFKQMSTTFHCCC